MGYGGGGITRNVFLGAVFVMALGIVFFSGHRLAQQDLPASATVEETEAVMEMATCLPETSIAETIEMASESDTVPETQEPEETMLVQRAEEMTLPEPVTLSQLDTYRQGVAPIPQSKVLGVTPLRQNPELPTGCESVALTMALQYLGFELEKTMIASDYLVRSGSNYGAGYVGNPFSDNGAGVFAPGLTLTANVFLQEQGSELEAQDISGTDFEELYSYVAAGYPVVIWTTMYFRTPNFTGGSCEYGGRTFRWYNNEHCVVLGGYDLDRGLVTIYDPLQGKVSVKAATLQRIYEKTGANALVICEAEH